MVLPPVPSLPSPAKRRSCRAKATRSVAKKMPKTKGRDLYTRAEATRSKGAPGLATNKTLVGTSWASPLVFSFDRDPPQTRSVGEGRCGEKGRVLFDQTGMLPLRNWTTNFGTKRNKQTTHHRCKSDIYMAVWFKLFFLHGWCLLICKTSLSCRI